MLKLIHDTTGEYRLTIEYRGKEYNYFTKRISSHIGEELWWIWTANRGILRLIYNTATKILKEDLQPGQQSIVPEDFMNELQRIFQSK